MWMRMLANYMDPYHRILTDALLREEKTMVIIYIQMWD